MPFTAAHPAIILPFTRRRLSATALVIGSMAPDFEYFFRLRTVSDISHTFLGLFLFNLPVTLLLSLLFHTLVRDVAIQHLPPYFKSRALAVSYPANWLRYLRSNWLAVSVSAVVGAFSHLFWDSFTHSGMYFVAEFPVLSQQVRLPVLELSMQLNRVLQHLSTVVGCVAILWFVHRLPASPIRQEQPWFTFWVAMFIAGIVFLLLNLLVREHLIQSVSYMIVTLISGWMLALFLSGVASKIRQQL
ncbi:DUF4184 family protein [Pontibacter mangrovi]|uniref:DUF4184 family protein n=1 Tax=Pontibacter mangrovi TaxID=2589816 RepID=A0A501WCR8_9BACT|nr:DUF4184 family protein [Pontibacter mangrovi]TPE44647.1 DUF4184 family protein [Pontibacter mangrovi]